MKRTLFSMEVDLLRFGVVCNINKFCKSTNSVSKYDPVSHKTETKEIGFYNRILNKIISRNSPWNIFMKCKLKLSKWPSQSCDMYTIENLWVLNMPWL